MKKTALLIICIMSLASCKSKSTIDPDTLPKDIALRPEHQNPVEEERKNLENLRSEIDELIAKEPCADASQWRISPIGAKSCGGPASFLAYPFKIESEILPKIKSYTELQIAYNKKYGIISDCAVVPSPSGISCENGKAVLIKSSSDTAVY